MEHLHTGLVSLAVGMLFVLHGYPGVKFHELTLKGGRRLHGRSAVVRGWIHVVIGVICVLLGVGFVGYWLVNRFF
jgi:hypothetical protein